MTRTRTEILAPTETVKDFGAVFTPAHIAQWLVRWAVHSPRDVVLDPGAGQGVFLLAAFERLRELGTSTEAARQQLFGVELQKEHFEHLTENVRASIGTPFPHLRHANLFQEEFPPLDAVIGNPPYVIRARLAEVNEVAQRVALRTQYAVKLRGQADLYCYFIMYAPSFLKEGGRMALIVSDAWLDADYGVELKEFLLQNFRIEALISFDRRVFPAALVKSLVLLAVRTKRSKANAPVRFIRVEQPGLLDAILAHLETDSSFDDGSAQVVLEPQGALNPRQYWGIYFKHPDLYFTLSTHPLVTELKQLAWMRIGLQTLAKRFYVLPANYVHEAHLEREYFEPIVVSPRDLAGPILTREQSRAHLALFCDKAKNQLKGTNVLGYIEAAERQIVGVRSKQEEVRGYHNLPRLTRAGRKPWYNLKSEVERRGRYPILLPRRVYAKFIVAWNQGAILANEDFIEVKPHRDDDIMPLLAALSSSFGEFMMRTLGHVYGGGVCNLNPNDVKAIPVLNLNKLGLDPLRRLAEAYNRFLAANGQDQTILDQVIFDLLDLDSQMRGRLYKALDELRGLSLMLKTPTAEERAGK